MKTVLILAGLVALTSQWELKTVDSDFIARQKKVLTLFEAINPLDTETECYKAGYQYNVEANVDHYTNKTVVEEFLSLYRTGFMPKYNEFSVFFERMRDEAISLFHIMYYAKDFDTFYKTAAWTKMYFNEGQFLYAYYIAVLQRPDTQGIVLPAPYEVFPEYFFNKDVISKMFYKCNNIPEMSSDFGVVKEQNHYVFYANYSNSLTYPNAENKLSYFTEDIGWNTYYYYFHTHLPFWWSSDKFGQIKERRGELYFFFYQQLLARYSLERLTNGMGEIPEFSWFLPFKTGYYPQTTATYLPFAQRSNYYDVHSEKNLESVRFLDAYEKTFFQFLQQGHFTAFDKTVDFHNPKAINFAGNYWQTNADLYSEEHVEDYQQSYEITARHVLSASPYSYDKYTFMPSALYYYQTSLRDPAFYQLYQRIVDYLVLFKEYLHPYTYEDLHFVGVKINDVQVNDIKTYFEYYDVKVTNNLVLSKEAYKYYPETFLVRQPRLDQEPFSVTIDIKADVASDAVFKIFLGPKYDQNGHPVNLENDWMKFYELDWFIHKLTPGANIVVRKSTEFINFKEDSMPISEIWKYLEQNKVAHDMSVMPFNLPRRLMVPKGVPGGFPLQMIVFVYPYNGVKKADDMFANFIVDNKAFGYPFDRPVNEAYFKQPNMFFKDVKICHNDEVFAYQLNTPTYFTTHKKV